MFIHTMKNTIKIISYFAIVSVLLGTIGTAEVSAQTLQQRDDAAKALYNQARQQYLNEVGFYKSARQDFQNALAKYLQFKTAANKAAMENTARNFLEKSVSSLIKRLETIKNWVANRGALSETEKQEITAEIDKDIAWLQERSSKIQMASPEAVKNEAKTVRTYWKTHRVRVKRITGRIQAARINFLIAKAENFSAEVAKKIEELNAGGKDTSQLESWLNDFNQKITLAKQKYEAAKAKFQEIKGEPGFDPVTELSQADQLFRQGNQFVKEANQYIREAHAQLVKIVKEMKRMSKEITPETETTQ